MIQYTLTHHGSKGNRNQIFTTIEKVTEEITRITETNKEAHVTIESRHIEPICIDELPKCTKVSPENLVGKFGPGSTNQLTILDCDDYHRSDLLYLRTQDGGLYEVNPDRLGDFGQSWPAFTAWGTPDPKAVEKFCEFNGLHFNRRAKAILYGRWTMEKDKHGKAD